MKYSCCYEFSKVGTFFWLTRYRGSTKGLFIWGKTHHLPDPGLRSEIPPSNRILCFFISRLHDERNTSGIVKFHLNRGGIFPDWGEFLRYKRNTTGMVSWIEIVPWFLLVNSFWFRGRETLLHLANAVINWYNSSSLEDTLECLKPHPVFYKNLVENWVWPKDIQVSLLQ